MRKRMLALLLAFVMAVGLLPTAAGAADAPSGVPAAGAHGPRAEHAGWTEWTDAGALPSSAGQYYLNTDVTLSSYWQPRNGVTLCLNGHVVRTTAYYPVIYVNSGVTLDICDCMDYDATDVRHKFSEAPDVPGLWTLDEAGGTKILRGGVITGGRNGNTAGGGGVQIMGGTLNLYGGNIAGNRTSTNGGGGGVYVGSGAFYMYGGAIAGNVARMTNTGNLGTGGGVSVAGGASFAMRGRAVAERTYGPNIHDNTAQAGGGVYNLGVVTMTKENRDCSPPYVQKNTAAYDGAAGSGYGGGVWTGTGSELTVEMGSVVGDNTGGNTALYGGGIFNNGTLTLQTGGCVSCNTAAGQGGGVYGYGVIHLTGEVIINNNTVNGGKNNLYLPDGKAVSAALSEYAWVYVTTEAAPTEGTPVNITGANEADRTSGFYSDAGWLVADSGAPDHCVQLQYKAPPHDGHDGLTFAKKLTSQDGKLCIDGAAQAADAQGFPLPAGDYYLAGDLALDASIRVASGAVNLCLNGHSVSISDPDSDRETIAVNGDGAALRLYNCKDDGAVIGNKGFRAGVMVYKGDLILHDKARVEGKTTGVELGRNGAAALTMKSGSSITAQSAGGATGLQIENPRASFTMESGAVIAAASAGGTATGIDSEGNGTITDGTVTAAAPGNKSGYALKFRGTPTISIRGNTILTGSTATVFSRDGGSNKGTLDVTGYVGGDVTLAVGVGAAADDVLVSGVSDGAAAEKFTLAAAPKGFTLATDLSAHTIKLSKASSPHICAGMGTSVTFDKVLTDQTLNITESGSYYLEKNVYLYDEGITIGEGVTVKLCLNGKNLGYGGNSAAIRVGRGGTLEVCCCTGPSNCAISAGSGTACKSILSLHGATYIHHSGFIRCYKETGYGIVMNSDDGENHDKTPLASTVIIEGNVGTTQISGGAAGINALGGSLTVKGGAIYNNSGGSTVEAGYSAGICAAGTYTLNISGGTIYGEDHGLYLTPGGATRLSGGNFWGRNCRAVYIADGIQIGDTPAAYADLLAPGCVFQNNYGMTVPANDKAAIEAEKDLTVVSDGSLPSHAHSWAAAWSSNAAHHWHECEGAGACDVTANSGKDGYGAHVYGSDQDAVCSTCGYMRELTYDISGTVTDNDNNRVEGAAVRLMKGREQIGETVTTDSSGSYSFIGIAPGLYNVVAAKDGVTKTILVEITNQNAGGQNIQMPDGSKNSVVDVAGADTPAVVVGGVDAIAEAESVLPGESVTVRLTVEKKNDFTADNAEEIKQAASGQTVEFLDLKLEKTVTGGTNDGTTSITDTQGKVLEIVVPYDFTGKQDVTVYRYHGGSAEVLTQADSKAGGTFRLSRDSVTIYATKFSIYAIGYTAASQTYTLIVNGGTGSGSYPAGTVVNISAAVPEGQQFTGWTGAAVADPGSANTTLTMPAADTVVTANFQSIWGGDVWYDPIIADPPRAAAYPVETLPAEGGSVSASLRNASEGTIVTLTLTPDQGYDPGGVIVTDEDGREITVIAADDGTYRFAMPSGKVTVQGIFARITDEDQGCPRDSTCPLWPYTDASVDAWYHDGVHYCMENGLMSGYGSQLFGPNDNLSRAQFAQILHNREDGPAASHLLPFEDVPDGAWYAEAVRWAAAQGIVSGYGSGMFGPGDPITREQVAVMLWRYAGTPAAAVGQELRFIDADAISSYALEAMRWALENGVISGYGDGRLVPQGLATRAQAAQMLKNYLDR